MVYKVTLLKQPLKMPNGFNEKIKKEKVDKNKKKRSKTKQMYL